jgi:hypothetical protein
MSTNASVEVFDEYDSLLITIYKHWDGDSLGEKLEKIAGKYTLVDGLRGNPGEANGMGCFAASLIKELKQEPGDIYIVTAGDYQQYNYKIKPDGDKIKVSS